MIIRRATLEDAAAMADVLRRSIIETCMADHFGDPAVITRWTANKTQEGVSGWIARDESHLYVVEEAGQIIAVGGVTDAGEINVNYVAPEAQGRGVGKAMMAAMEDYLQARGIASIWLEASQTGRAFYTRLGYQQHGETPAKFGGAPAILMRRNLAGAEQ